MVEKIKEIYQYRTMISSLVKRDLRGRYAGSVLGFAWNFVNPLLQLLVYTFVFSMIMRAGIKDYYLYLFVALVPWIFFNTSVAGGASCILGQRGMVEKIYFPREVLPIAHVTTAFVNMLLSFVVVFAVLLVSGKGVSFILLPVLIPIMIIEYIMALGFAFLFSCMTVYFRDLEHILGIFMMAWQFASPVMYGMDMIPESLHGLFMLNPMTPVILAYRDVLYYQQMPDIKSLMTAILCGLVVVVLGWVVFERLQRHFVEEL